MYLVAVFLAGETSDREGGSRDENDEDNTPPRNSRGNLHNFREEKLHNVELASQEKSYTYLGS
jgi:hypothetical protein